MAGVLDGVNRRTQLAGENRLELLMFRLGSRQRFGINVFKVQEVIQCPPLTQLPHAHPAIKGVINMRGKTISIIDLAYAIGRRPVTDISNCNVIVTEYNRNTQGFLVDSVDRIENLNWSEIHPPPRGAGSNYMTAVTNIDDELVEIIDVEKILAEVMTVDETISSKILEQEGATGHHTHHVLVVDDSSVARNQVRFTLDQLGINTTLATDGAEGLAILKSWADEVGESICDRLSMVISDVEMPSMDGYTMTTEIRNDPRLKDLHVILHTSMSGEFNHALVDKVGANKFIAKFKPDELAQAVLERVHDLDSRELAN